MYKSASGCHRYGRYFPAICVLLLWASRFKGCSCRLNPVSLLFVYFFNPPRDNTQALSLSHRDILSCRNLLYSVI